MVKLKDGHMKKHATKMGRNTAFHAEAERVRVMNQQAATVSDIYYADSMIKELKRIARNSRSKRRERYINAFNRRSATLREHIRQIMSKPIQSDDDRAKISLWRKMLIRDDDRAYGLVRTSLSDPSNIHDWMWWTKNAEHERFDLVELSSPVKSERNRLKKIFGL